MEPFDGNAAAPPPPALPPDEGAAALVASSNEEEEDGEQQPAGSEDGTLSDESSDEDSDTEDDDESSVGETHTYTEAEILQLEKRLYTLDSELDDINERWEEESVRKIKDEITEELSKTLSGAELDAAVEDELSTLKEHWEYRAFRLHTKISNAQEKLEEAGFDLTTYYKNLDKQTPEVCETEVWKNATWAGVPVTLVAMQGLLNAEEQLKVQRPVKNHLGKVIEQGASGFLAQRYKGGGGGEESSGDAAHAPLPAEEDVGWDVVNELADGGSGPLMGTKRWDQIYTASTPEEAASLGLKLPGEDKVEEIGDVDKVTCPLLVAALASEKERGLNTRVNVRKVKEEDDVKKTCKLYRGASRKAAGPRKARKTSDNKSVERPMPTSFANDSQCLAIIQVGPVRDTTPRKDGQCSNGKTDAIVALQRKRSARVAALACQSPSPDAKRPRLLLIDVHGVAHEEDESDGGLPLEAEKCLPASPDREFDCFDVLPRARKRRRIRVYIDDDDEVTEVVEYASEEDKEATKLSMLPPAASEGPQMPSAELPCQDSLALTWEGGLDTPTGAHQPGMFSCTGCGNLIKASEILKHPLLPVGICFHCNSRYHSGPFTKGEDGSESECRWCGDGGSIVCCDKCDKVFCESCIHRNFGEQELKRILESENWECYMCNKEPLKSLAQLFIDAQLTSVARRGGKSGKQRRNIKRISSYSEKTKELHAQEEERQERQERWRANEARDASGLMGQSPDKNALHASDEGLVINVARPEDEAAIRISPYISKNLRPHQLEGVRFMWENCIESVQTVNSGSPGQGCILAHSMGLGKTLQVIAFLHTILRRSWSIQRALVVVPLNVLHNWKKEFKRWQPRKDSPRIHMVEELSRDDARIQVLEDWFEGGGVLLIGYTSFRSWLSKTRHGSSKAEFCKYLLSPGPDILVCDEAHLIKNEKAEITKVLKSVSTRRRVALTGSPMQNNLMEYYCMVDFVREAFLESPQTFRNKFLNPIENGQLFDSTAKDVRTMKYRAHVLHRRLKGFVQRVDMNVLKDELPPKNAFIISVRLSPVQRRLYQTFLSTHGFSNPGFAITHHTINTSLFHAYHALLKVWNHPDILWLAKEAKDAKELKASKLASAAVDEFEEGAAEVEDNGWWKDEYPSNARGSLEASGKMQLVLELLRLFRGKGDKALIFSQSLRTLDLIESYLELLPNDAGGPWRKSVEWYRLDGRTPASTRQTYVDSFNNASNKKCRCMLISTRAGSLGINLPAANRVIIVDGSWNPTHDLQALFRVWRFGQTKPVFAYRLCAAGTMEEKIYKRQVFKESVAARVVDKVEVSRLLKGHDLMELFRLDDDSDGHNEEWAALSGRTAPGPHNPSSASNLTKPGEGGDADGGAKVAQATGAEGTEEANDDAKEAKDGAKCGGPGCFGSGSPVAASEPVKDDVMQSLLDLHRPRWIVQYHEHEPLLVDIKEEKLTAEEEAAAWESYQQSTEEENQNQHANQQQLQAQMQAQAVVGRKMPFSPAQGAVAIQTDAQTAAFAQPPVAPWCGARMQVSGSPRAQVPVAMFPQLQLTPMAQLQANMQGRFSKSPVAGLQEQPPPQPPQQQVLVSSGGLNLLQIGPHPQQVQVSSGGLNLNAPPEPHQPEVSYGGLNLQTPPLYHSLQVHSTGGLKLQQQARPELLQQARPELLSGAGPQLQAWIGAQVQPYRPVQQQLETSPGVQLQPSSQLQQVQQCLNQHQQTASWAQAQVHTERQAAIAAQSAQVHRMSSGPEQQVQVLGWRHSPPPLAHHQHAASTSLAQQLQLPHSAPPSQQAPLQQAAWLPLAPRQGEVQQQQARGPSPHGKGPRYQMCNQADHERFFRMIDLKVGDKVTCDTCKHCVGWEAVNIVELD